MIVKNKYSNINSISPKQTLISASWAAIFGHIQTLRFYSITSAIGSELTLDLSTIIYINNSVSLYYICQVFDDVAVMIASLPMYDIVEVRHALDALWTGMARHFRHQGINHVPRRLTHDKPVSSLWSDDNMFISQCCGYDIVHGYKDRLQVLATPWFDVPGCSNGNYSSLIIVPEDSLFCDAIDMEGTVAVINGHESHSGMNTLFSLVAPHSQNNKFFSEIKISGSHAESLVLLKKRQAEVASVDCIIYELLKRYRPAAIKGTRPLGFTYSAPTPPYITRGKADMETFQRMQNALLETFEDQTLADSRQRLLMNKIELTSANLYQRIPDEFSHNLRAI